MKLQIPVRNSLIIVPVASSEIIYKFVISGYIRFETMGIHFNGLHNFIFRSVLLNSYFEHFHGLHGYETMLHSKGN
jgi:hypothetical protein